MSLLKCDPEEYLKEVGDEIAYYKCVRGYVCENCGDKFAEITKKVGFKPKSQCPSCKKHDLDSLCLGTPLFFVKEITTVGQLAEQNNKKLGKYGVEDTIMDIKTRKLKVQQQLLEESKILDADNCDIGGKEKNKTWFNPTGEDLSPLANMNEQQQKDYILTGKK